LREKFREKFREKEVEERTSNGSVKWKRVEASGNWC
jgi:hypothetical protein